jgi:hypothetical protein
MAGKLVGCSDARYADQHLFTGFALHRTVAALIDGS